MGPKALFIDNNQSTSRFDYSSPVRWNASRKGIVPTIRMVQQSDGKGVRRRGRRNTAQSGRSDDSPQEVGIIACRNGCAMTRRSTIKTHVESRLIIPVLTSSCPDTIVEFVAQRRRIRRFTT